jgi:hypothetical protein
MTLGYHQILISEEDRPTTTFRAPFGHFQFQVLIEGLTNAPATFQKMMNSMFHPYIKNFVVVYIDDIPIFSELRLNIKRTRALCWKCLDMKSFSCVRQSPGLPKRRLSTVLGPHCG